MHGLLTVAGVLGLIALAFGPHVAARCAAVLLGLLAVFAVAVVYAMLWPEGSWIDCVLGIACRY
jgi:hypothetical protein